MKIYSQNCEDLQRYKELITTLARFKIIDSKTYQNTMLEIIHRLLVGRGKEVQALKEELNKPDTKSK